MLELVEYMVRALVDNPEDVRINEIEGETVLEDNATGRVRLDRKPRTRHRTSGVAVDDTVTDRCDLPGVPVFQHIDAP